MFKRCIFASATALIVGCVSPNCRAAETGSGAPPENRTLPHLTEAASGLPVTWFMGPWRVEGTSCVITLEPSEDTGQTGAARPSECPAPWSQTREWRTPSDGRALFEIVSADGAPIWGALLIQPTALRGERDGGGPVRLYWAGEGVHGGWVQPRGEPTP